EHDDWDLETQSFSDLQILDGSKEKLGVEQSRMCSSFLKLAPLNSKRRVLLIKQANKLTPTAQNAILKIAEEPPSRALIILILKDPGALLETLRSRFQEIYFSGEEYLNSEQAQEMAKEAKNFLSASNNKARSEILKALVSDEKPFDLFVKALLEELSKDKEKNATAISQLLSRWALMSQYSANKRLQIEAIIQHLN
ncbi:MAG: hypothetical protein Q8Q32_00590, partial [bacterium]|nr:hypothetical protein [bacterium]